MFRFFSPTESRLDKLNKDMENLLREGNAFLDTVEENRKARRKFMVEHNIPISDPTEANNNNMDTNQQSNEGTRTHTLKR